ncbi:abasic site processing protein HMCES [Pectinophora gossypiella]|uniref:abasic site processing protein HMCES n=1 Tax=Pectinophora gossypiella TaxID=13191 RepID=UPI00214E9AFF|nr:abasic site processing protein HMCES [Pectinophora gossypiella]
MCGRTGLSLNQEQVCCACSYKANGGDLYIKPEWLHEHNNGKEYTPSYNIAPSDVTPVLVSASKYRHAANTDRVLKPMLWGIIPPWHKGDYRTHNLSTNNCRLENINTSKLYGPILRSGGRCIIPVEGFYEWKTTEKLAKVKQPYYIYAPQARETKIDDPSTWSNTYSNQEGWRGINLLYMAGLYYVWQHITTIIYSYSVITLESNDTLKWLHHRMPAILDTPQQIQMWLDVNNVDAETAVSCLKPVQMLSWHPVSTAVNNSRNKSDDCNKRQPEKKTQNPQKTITAWFTKTEKRKLTKDEMSTCKKLKT